MLGPEKLPYGSLGAYANAVSAQYDLNSRETAQFLVDAIPAEALPVIARETYAQTAKLSDAAEDPGYYGALESMAWADTLEVKYRRYSRATSLLGATVGSAVGIVAQTTRYYNSTSTTAESVVPVQYEFLDVAADVSLIFGPILAAGVVGAWVGKKDAPKIMKDVARGVVRRKKESQSTGMLGDSADVSLPLLPEEMNLTAASPATPEGHPEAISELRLYDAARRCANRRGCEDEEKYADFLIADMPTGELNSLLLETKKRLVRVLSDDESFSPQDPIYTGMLRDLQIARSITKRRIEAGRALMRVGRGIGYIGLAGYASFMLSGTPVNTDLAETLSYADVLSDCVSSVFGFAIYGYIGGGILETQRNFLARSRSKRQVDHVLNDLKTKKD